MMTTTFGGVIGVAAKAGSVKNNDSETTVVNRDIRSSG
jgi:hypothetical protein